MFHRSVQIVRNTLTSLHKITCYSLNNLQETRVCFRRSFGYGFVNISTTGHLHCRCTHYNPSNLVLNINGDDDAKKFCSQLWDEIQASVSSKNALGEEASENLYRMVQVFDALRCDTRNVFALVSANPKIVNCNWEKFRSLVIFLDELGMGSNRILRVLNNRHLWKSDVTRLLERIVLLRNIGIVEGKLQKVVANCPEVLTLRQAQIKSVLNLLKESKFTREQIISIICDCPRVLTENRKDTEYLFQYVYFKMGLTDHSQMVQAKLFQHSIEHIKQRHLFLERCGIYEAPSFRSRSSRDNPKLYAIVDTSLSKFCKMFRVASVEEFIIFCEELKHSYNEDEEEEDVDELKNTDNDTV